MYDTSVLQAERPRNVNKWQAAAILYGDWGTSKVYVIGLAFAIGGYSSFWLIFFVSLLSIIVGINYVTICKCYPNGGGVYSSVRNRSKVLALVGGFFLIADYIVTAALSALSAFEYLGVSHPEFYALSTILFIGALNFLGPRNTGSMAIVVSLFAFASVLFLGYLSFLHIDTAIAHTQRITGSWSHEWVNFVGVIVALSGIEAIANTTGVMRLNPGTTIDNPSVTKTSTPAILMVLAEVSFFTCLLALAVNALPGLHVDNGEVSAPGYPNVRDAMLRYMSEVFSAQIFGETIAIVIGYAITISFGILLLSAVNTALVGLNSLLFVMSHDGQMPRIFQRMNKFGVPKIPLLIATLVPAGLLLLVNDIVGLANLYAVGFVGAIATNLGSTCTDFKLKMGRPARLFMFFTFLIMGAIEVTLFFEKGDARAFVITIMAIGLLLRAMVLEHKDRSLPKQPPLVSVTTETAKRALQFPSISRTSTTQRKIPIPIPIMAPAMPEVDTHLHQGAILCATTHLGKCLEFALNESVAKHQKIYILFIREQKVNPQSNMQQHWLEDPQAGKIFDYALDFLKGPNFSFLYDISDVPALNIVEKAKALKVSQVVLGMSRENQLIRMIRGNVVKEVRDRLPSNIDLIIVS